ncbi:MAG: glycosyltransferase family 39 protein [Chloroflexota bacterium]
MRRFHWVSSRLDRFRPYGATLGLAAALAGQHLLANKGDARLGGVLLALGAVVFTWASWGDWVDRVARTDQAAAPCIGPRAMANALLTPVLFNLVALTVFWRGTLPNTAWLVWLGSVVATGYAGWRLVGRPRPSVWPWPEVVLVVLATALAAAFRVYRIDELPPGLWWDEAVGGLEVKRILAEPTYRPIYKAELINSPYLWFYVSAACVWLLGPTSEALRLAATIGGVLFPVGVYAVARQLYGPRAAIPASIIAACLLWNVNFSRNGWSYAWTLSLDAMAVALFARAVLRHSPGAGLAAGLVWGLALQGYNPARLIAVVLAVLVGAALLRDRRDFLRGQRTTLALFAIGALVTASPLVLFAAVNPGEYFARAQTVWIMNEVRQANSWQPLIDSVRQHVLMFNVAGDRNGRHNLPGAPMLDQVTAALFVLGLAAAVARLWRAANLATCAWLLVGLAAGALTLAFEAPQGLRAIEASTPAIVLAGVCLALYYGACRTAARGRLGWGPEVIGGLLLTIVGLNYYAYFVAKANDFAAWAAYSTAESIAAGIAAEHVATHNVYLDEPWTEHPTIKFLAPALDRGKSLNLVTNVPLRDDKPVVLLLRGELTAPIEDIDWLYSDTNVQSIEPPFGGPSVVRFLEIPKASIDRARGVTVATTPASTTRAHRETAPSLDLAWDSLPEGPFSLDVSGAVAVPEFGRYEIALDGPAGATLDLGGMVTVNAGETAEALLPRGNVALRMLANVQAPTRIGVRWKAPGAGGLTPVPASALFKGSDAARGLLAQYRRGTDAGAPVQLSQIERYVQRALHLLPFPRPYTVEWTGVLQVERAGVYRFYTDAVGRAAIWLDDRELIRESAGRSAEATVTLESGDHPIRIRFWDVQGFSRLDVQWTPPGQERQSLPARMLTPPRGPIDRPTQPARASLPALAALGEPEVKWLASGFSEARGVAAAADGSAFVVDSKKRELTRISADGDPVARWTDVDLVEPVDVELDGDGAAWVLDAENGWVTRFAPDGSRRRIGGPNLGTYKPRGLGIGPSGSIFIANTGGHQIIELLPDGSTGAIIGPETGGPETIRQPTDVAVAPNGDLLVVSAERNAVLRLDRQGRYQTHWAISGSDTVRGPHVAIGPDGGVYVTDPRTGRVGRYGMDGQQAGVIEATRQGRIMKTPVGIAVATTGRVLVADPTLGAVVAIDLDGGN